MPALFPKKIKVIYDGLLQGQVYEMAQSLDFSFQHIQDALSKLTDENFFLLTRSVKFGQVSDDAKTFLDKNATKGNRCCCVWQ